MPAHARHTPERDDAFFAALENGATVAAAAPLAGLTRQALYRRRITDRAFDARWHAIEKTLAANAQARRRKRTRAMDPIFETKRLSDGELLRRLKTLAPDRYQN